ncbi:capsid scaffolding serine peptidase GPO [Agitococcus lubricus]|uniref:Capsid scaffolding serine peptidase GPO n=2 Tax=Agitococcus lubricus TaxID=1077255 RepID=A0A2T5J1H5_9GAMM|nr:capsid scaffolding serine peptidase GPO [Agitococcus lubricus]
MQAIRLFHFLMSRFVGLTMRKKFRVAVEGQTTDRRAISRQDIMDMAKNYNQQTYGARVWLEHFRGLFPDSAFKAYGDVISCTAEEIKDGDLKGKMALFAEIDASNDLVAMAKAKQKVYFSVEIQPDFPAVGGSYLVGLAVTDSPASLGTEYITFSQTAKNSPLAARKQKPENLISTSEEVWEFSEDPITSNEPSLFNKILAKLRPKEEKVQANFSDIEKCFEEVTKYCTNLKATVDNLGKQLTKIETELAAEKQASANFRTKIDGQPPANYTQRPPATGGNGQQQTDC